MKTKAVITVETEIKAHIAKVWECWTNTDAIIKWNTASPDWHTTRAMHDLKPGGEFNYRMEAKDGSFGFDLVGTFNLISPFEYLETTFSDGRKIKTTFTAQGNGTQISQTFEAEDINSIEMQRGGWQSILNNFKKYAEAHV